MKRAILIAVGLLAIFLMGDWRCAGSRRTWWWRRRPGWRRWPWRRRHARWWWWSRRRGAGAAAAVIEEVAADRGGYSGGMTHSFNVAPVFSPIVRQSTERRTPLKHSAELRQFADAWRSARQASATDRAVDCR